MNFIQQVYKGKNDWWRYILGLLLIFLGWQFVGIIPLAIVAILHSPNIQAFQQAATDNFMSLGINANLYLFSMIMMFAIGLLFIYWVITKIHKRSFTSALTSRKKLDWKRVFFAFGIWFMTALILFGIDYFMAPQNFKWNFKFVPFLTLVLVSLFFLPLQTSFEEVLFRGYLMQSIGALTKTRWFPLVFTAISFGLLHSFNPEVEKLGYIVMIYYIGTGLLFGMTTLFDEGMELALGMHAANNIVAAVFVTTNWTVFQTDALFIDTSEPNLKLEMYVPVFIIYPLLLFLFSKKYGWRNWKKKLLGRIESDHSIKPNDSTLRVTDQ